MYRPGPVRRPAGRRRAFTKRCQAWLEAAVRLRQGAPHALVHRRARRWPRSCWTSSGDEVIMPSYHLRLDGERVRAARRDAGVRRHPAGHAQPRRRACSSADHAPHPRDRAGALRRRRLRNGRDPRHSAAPTGSRGRGRRAGRARELQGARARQHRRPRDATASTRPRTSSPARAGALLINDPRWSRAPRSSAKRAPTAAGSSAGRSTSTPGRISARPTCPARSPPRSCWRSSRTPRPSRSSGKVGVSYHELLAPLEQEGLLRRPVVPPECAHNGHMYYALIAPGIDRQAILDLLRQHQIWSVFHYVPLHSSPAGQRYGRAHGDLTVTDDVATRLVRLPLWVGLTLT